MKCFGDTLVHMVLNTIKEMQAVGEHCKKSMFSILEITQREPYGSVIVMFTPNLGGVM